MTMGKGVQYACVVFLCTMSIRSSLCTPTDTLQHTLPSPRQTVVHCCAAQNFVEFLKDLTELGASFEIADDKGMEPLGFGIYKVCLS